MYTNDIEEKKEFTVRKVHFKLKLLSISFKVHWAYCDFFLISIEKVTASLVHKRSF